MPGIGKYDECCFDLTRPNASNGDWALTDHDFVLNFFKSKFCYYI